MKKTIIPLICITLACACNKNNNVGIQDIQTVDAETPVCFTVQNAASTKAAEINSLDKISITCSTGVPGLNEKEKWTESQISVKDGKVTTGRYWPANDEKYIFYASNQIITPRNSGPEVTVSSNYDCLVARNLTPSYKATNTLTFKHVLSRIVECTITGPSGYTLSNAKLEIIPATEGKYNCGTQAYTDISNGSKVNLASSTGDRNTMDLWTLPGSFDLSASYTLSKGDWTKDYTATRTISLLPGKRHKINASFTIPQGDEVSSIDFNVEIIDWEDEITDITF